MNHGSRRLFVLLVVGLGAFWANVPLGYCYQFNSYLLDVTCRNYDSLIYIRTRAPANNQDWYSGGVMSGVTNWNVYTGQVGGASNQVQEVFLLPSMTLLYRHVGPSVIYPAPHTTNVVHLGRVVGADCLSNSVCSR